MTDLTPSQQKEIVEEILINDKDFLSLHRIELNLFKYTSLFAVFAFTFEFMFQFIQNFYGLSYFTFGQLLLSSFGLIGILVLIALYVGLTMAIRRSLHGKGAPLKHYYCESCNYNSFSSFSSTLHIVANPEHTLNGHLIMVKYSRMKFTKSLLISLLKLVKRRLKESYDPELVIFSESDRRIKHEISKNHKYLIKFIMWTMILALSVIFPVIIDYSILKSLVLAIQLTILTFGCVFIASLIIAFALVEGNTNFVYILKIKSRDVNKTKSEQIRLQLIKVGRKYWEHVKKGADLEQIDAEMGPLYIIGKVVLNKYGELIEVSPPPV